jgi:hypothetical protein
MNDRVNPPDETVKTNLSVEKEFLERFFALRINALSKDPTNVEFPLYMKAQRIVRRLAEGFQPRVQAWVQACFGYKQAMDKPMRNRRFLEEALELVQACGLPKEQALALVEYTYSRPIGKPYQEVGGVMTTLASLCAANDIDMAQAGDDELISNWGRVNDIRLKSSQKDDVIASLTPATLKPTDPRNSRRWEALRDIPEETLGRPGVPTLMVNHGTMESPNFVAYTGDEADTAGDHAILLASQARLRKGLTN